MQKNIFFFLKKKRSHDIISEVELLLVNDPDIKTKVKG